MEKPILLFDPEVFTKEWADLFSGYSCNSILKGPPNGPLIRWGITTGSDYPPLTLNRKRPLMNTLNREMAFKVLKLNRVRRPEVIAPQPSSTYPIVAKSYNPKNRSSDKLIQNYSELNRVKADFHVQHIVTLKDYRAWVFDAKVFHLEKKIPVKSNTSFLKLSDMEYYEPIPENLDADSKKAAHLAVKAVHLTGLDFAEVRIGLDRRSRPVILDLNPVLSFNKKISKKFVELLNNYFTEKTGNPPLSKIVLGADPEFVLRNQLTGGLVYPSSFIDKEGFFGYDERSERRQQELFPLAEVRPAPDPCPLRLMSKIKSAMENGLKKIPYRNIEWLAGCVHFGRYQIGGHIHFSGIELSSSLLRALDNYLGIIFSLIENHEASAQRRRHYGGLGNVRIKPHGGFEYRTLGSWLVTPEITQAVLCLAKVVGVEHRNLTRDFFVSYPMQQAFYQSDKSAFYQIFPLLWSDIKSTDTYKKYESELRVIPEMVNKRQTWNEQQDIRKAWRLPIPDQVLNIKSETKTT